MLETQDQPGETNLGHSKEYEIHRLFPHCVGRYLGPRIRAVRHRPCVFGCLLCDERGCFLSLSVPIILLAG